VNNDHRMGFPPALLALEEAGVVPRRTYDPKPPPRVKLTPLQEDARRIADNADTAKLTPPTFAHQGTRTGRATRRVFVCGKDSDPVMAWVLEDGVVNVYDIHTRKRCELSSFTQKEILGRLEDPEQRVWREMLSWE
jgi:hypothetical protein